ncbi:MAG: tRNA (adenosine(37)-N6)-threonylcarbamoyltransferase complex transferase subunit TsaD [Opitutales bacterium]
MSVAYVILAVESSCDESALALFEPSRGLIFERLHSQVALHRDYGGVVPDLASRQHLDQFGPLLEALPPDCFDSIDRISVTRGPGLAGCLALGMQLAQSLALACGCPLVGVNHLRAHAYSVFIDRHAADPGGFEHTLPALLPHLGLLVSGGNTLLFVIGGDRSLRLLGQTMDDAAGEALDKGAKLMGLGYPGGPEVERNAARGDPTAVDFPRAMSGPASADAVRFSFSGLKTSLRYRLEKMNDAAVAQALPDLCASYQQAVVDQLTGRLRQVLQGGGAGRFASLGLSGGVSNNCALREACGALAQAQGLPLLLAQPRHTGDNAGMIAFAAHADPQGLVEADARGCLPMEPSLPLVTPQTQPAQ